jgi:hypothetical protein
MNRNWLYALVAVCLCGVLGVGTLWGYRQYKRKRDQLWEASGSLPLARPLGDVEMKKFLEEENKVLDKEEILLPVVRQLGLVAAFHVANEAEAVARLRERSEVRKGSSAVVVLVFRDRDRDLAARVSRSLGDAFVRAHNKRPDAPGGETPGY